MGIMKPTSIIKGVIPVIMAGILGIYGLIVAVFQAKNYQEMKNIFLLKKDTNIQEVVYVVG